MAKDYAEAFYNSKQWLDCRASYIDNHAHITHEISTFVKLHETLGKPNTLSQKTYVIITSKCYNLIRKDRLKTAGDSLPPVFLLIRLR